MNTKQLDIIQFQNQICRPLILDGAVGSILQQRNIPMHKVLWSSNANIFAPDKVTELHQEYINAGADIITTNTFRTNPIAYNMSELQISNLEFVQRSVELAIKASKGNSSIFIAGSNPPAEDSYQTYRKSSKIEIEENHNTHIDFLWDSGVDLILNETQSHFDEIKIICNHCTKNNLPFIISLFVTTDGNILSGESLSFILKYVRDFNPIAVGINCVNPVTFSKLLSTIDDEYRWGFYLNCGNGKYTDKEIFEGITPTNYIDAVNNNFKHDPFFIGSCCGSSPKHTKAIKDFIIGNN